MKKIFLASIVTSLFILPTSLANEVDFPSLYQKNYSIVIDGTKEKIEKNLQAFKKTPMYVVSPENQFLPITYETLISHLNISEIHENNKNFVSISLKDPTDLLNQTIFANKEIPFLHKGSDVILTKTSSGSTLPYSISGELLPGYNLQYDDFLFILLKSIAEGKKGTAIRLPTDQTSSKVIFKDGHIEKNIDIVAEGISNFHGSTNNRIHNIKTAMLKFNGYVIPKGATFSFTDILGIVDGSTGYKKELVIKGPKVEMEYGGGVCQVSSTIYRAALKAGYEITERKAHSFAVHYYEPWGTDATVYPGIQDLKFINDSPSDIIVHYFIHGDDLHTNFYGVSDGRKVTLDGPHLYGFEGIPAPTVETVSYLAPGKRIVKEGGVQGFAAWWERKIQKPNVPEKKEIIDTIYPPKKGYVYEGASAAPSTNS